MRLKSVATPRAAVASRRHDEPDSLPLRAPDAAIAFAHELANLLDGGHRQLGLALAMLRDASGGPTAGEPTEGREALLRKLDATDHAMKQMTLLLRRWMRGATAIHVSVDRPHTLGQLIEHVVGIARPRADELGVRIVASVGAEASALPAGPLYAAVDNALRNSLDALAPFAASPGRAGVARGRSSLRARAATGSVGTISLTADVSDGVVSLAIIDDGPGFPPGVIDRDGAPRLGVTTRPDGHGVGLTLIAEIVHALRGRLDIRNGDAARTGPTGRTRRTRPGACVTLRYPVASLHEPSEAVAR